MYLELGDSPSRATQSRVETFLPNGGSFSTWNALPNETMAMFIVIGSGAGGGGGMTGAIGTIRGGGAGGDRKSVV